MASRLVKGYNLSLNNELKVISFPKFEPMLEETESLFIEELQPDLVQLNREHEQALINQRKQAEIELADWKKAEQEEYRIELEEEKKRGFQEGYQMGFEEGRNHGLGQYIDLLKKAEDHLKLAYEEKMAIIEEAEPFVIELSVAIAKKIVQQEMKTNEEALLPMIKESLSSVYESSSLSIHVAPEDYAFVQKQREHLLEVVNGKMEVKIIPDYSIQHGGCIIHTSSGSVDARIDVQLSEIKKALLAHQQEGNRE